MHLYPGAQLTLQRGPCVLHLEGFGHVKWRGGGEATLFPMENDADGEH